MLIDQNVLVLNNSYSPLYVVKAKRAFNLLFREKAEIIDTGINAWISYDIKSWEEASKLKASLENDFKYLRGSNDYILGVPKVIRLLTYAKENLKISFTRKNIFLRDNYTCQYCGAKKSTQNLNIDHVIPRHQGGRNSWENLVCSCIPCNTKKRDRTPKEAGLELLRKPVKPSKFLIFKHYLNNEETIKDWSPFLPENVMSEVYWNTELIE